MIGIDLQIDVLHSNKIRVILELNPTITSDQHPWAAHWNLNRTGDYVYFYENQTTTTPVSTNQMMMMKSSSSSWNNRAALPSSPIITTTATDSAKFEVSFFLTIFTYFLL